MITNGGITSYREEGEENIVIPRTSPLHDKFSGVKQILKSSLKSTQRALKDTSRRYSYTFQRHISTPDHLRHNRSHLPFQARAILSYVHDL
jgi:hypothetical protein